MLNSTGGNLPTASKIVPAILSVVLDEAVDEDAFSAINNHIFDSIPDNNHLFSLIKCIAKCFLKIRMHHQARKKLQRLEAKTVREH